MKTLFSAAAAIALVVVNSGLSIAAIEFATVNDTIKLYDGLGGRGGIFYVDVLGAGNVSTTAPFNGSSPYYDFPTFCVEIEEHITPGSSNTYFVDNVSDTTVSGNKKLGSFAAWLYTEYLEAVTSPAAAGLELVSNWGTTASHANAIQRGIWLSMGYSISDADGAIDGSGYDSAFFGSLFQAYKDSAWSDTATHNVGNDWNYGYVTGQVAIMNLTNGTVRGGSKAQDQLVINPELPPGGGAPVPEPMSLLVWSLFAVCIGGCGVGRYRVA